jgi:hypothetical protein
MKVNGKRKVVIQNISIELTQDELFTLHNFLGQFSDNMINELGVDNPRKVIDLTNDLYHEMERLVDEYNS